MKNKKMICRFFTIADYKDEEEFLMQQHSKGWKLIKMIPPCFYTFEKCQPENYVYQLDFPDLKQSDKKSYLKLFEDCGWEYLGECINWIYFRKLDDHNVESFIFSDTQSKTDMIDRVLKRRMLPLGIILLCCIIPQLFRIFENDDQGILGYIMSALFIVLFIFYVYLLLHCGLKLKQLKEEIENESY